MPQHSQVPYQSKQHPENRPPTSPYIYGCVCCGSCKNNDAAMKPHNPGWYHHNIGHFQQPVSGGQQPYRYCFVPGTATELLFHAETSSKTWSHDKRNAMLETNEQEVSPTKMYSEVPGFRSRSFSGLFISAPQQALLCRSNERGERQVRTARNEPLGEAYLHQLDRY